MRLIASHVSARTALIVMRSTDFGVHDSDLDPAPRAKGIEEDEEIDGAVAAILVVEAIEPSGCGRDRLARFADEIGCRSRSQPDHRP
jgi:hypothetical protein